MGHMIERSGKRYGRLVAVEPVGRSVHRDVMWRCTCDCGNSVEVRSGSLTSGNSTSCGCKQREHAATLGGAHPTHGHSRRGSLSPEYRAWRAMKSRCYWPPFIEFQNYGGRGIVVCDRWRESFETFLADIGPRPGKGWSLDRIDVNGNYEPSNCRWATAKEQASNTRVNRNVQIGGETMTVTEASRRLQIVPRGTTASRISEGWDLMEALTRPRVKPAGPVRRSRIGF